MIYTISLKKPNFFIVGMPRAGTTSLYHYLGEHPNIFMSPEKEPHFFGSDLTRGELFRQLDEKEYLSLFSKAHDQKILGEASVDYLSSKMAAKEIYNFNPQAKILISLRNPVDQCYSYYFKHRMGTLEPIEDFSQAIDDKREPSIPIWWTKESLYYKQNIKNLPLNIRRYIDVFGEQNVKIILFDDLKKNPAVIYKDILNFLGVHSDFLPYFRIHNEHRMIRFWWLARFYLEASPLKNYPRMKKHLKRIYFHKIWHIVRKLIGFLNTKKSSRPNMPLTLRESLIQDFLPVVEELEGITGRDLSAWKTAHTH